jgi:hypothetical protein
MHRDSMNKMNKMLHAYHSENSIGRHMESETYPVRCINPGIA